MEKLTIKAYAKKEKISIFNAMKRVREGSVSSETVLEEGREVIYVLDDAEQAEKRESSVAAPDLPQRTFEEEIAMLKKEVAQLRKELEALKKKL
ncbi:DUF5320 domain-containing protein [Sulfurovum sp.]|jgi:uncharacterized protein YceH (UPF0502 family)|uniref:DUF5320 domain-containing protein n=1 Tax=Sulfurovum sp. TaxID=1969726 RepID=UPI002A358D6C|nr:DUF5320 domain-containing protein [Sulfurovum sp.]MDD2450698.1 DUF5320 domain-containing protein [Sulfurovum sp.]MDD3499777.1 DUF5320 domain-containing protein [Sulfurovum sp.]MDY0403546.1 DUF5320 domain-containing protein [Sulfurovum sp.]